MIALAAVSTVLRIKGEASGEIKGEASGEENEKQAGPKAIYRIGHDDSATLDGLKLSRLLRA